MPLTLRSSVALAVLGSALLISPAPGAAAPRTHTGARVHIVYPGQTLAMIAKRYNVSVDELCKANKISRRRPLHPKQRLVIPGKELEVLPAVPAAPEVIPAAYSTPHVDLVEPIKSAYAKKPQKRGLLNIQSYT